MIAELLTALRGERRNNEELLQRIDALLQRHRRLEPVDPSQPLLFPELAQPEPAAPSPRRRERTESTSQKQAARSASAGGPSAA